MLATLGPRVLGEYRMNTISNMRESLANVEVVAYANFLESRGIRLEDTLEWTYNVFLQRSTQSVISAWRCRQAGLRGSTNASR